MTPFLMALAALDRAAHESAFGRNALPTPSDAQCQAGNYRVGRANIHGLPISIEQPRDSVRCGTDASGKAWRSRMAAHYGYINGTRGADGDPVDCFIGDWPISNTVWVINQHIDGKFDEHKVMLLFNREDMARAAYLDSYEPGWNGIGSMIKLTPTQLSFWLKSGDMSKPLTSDQLFNEGFHPMNTPDPTWDSGAKVARAWYEVERQATGMDAHELHEPLTIFDAMDGGQLFPRFDALVVTMGKAQAKLAAMQSVLARQGSTLSVVGMQITDPFRQAGTTNIVAIYELSDGQTVSIYLHNPDTTPNKLAPTDAMVAWKWLLNRRDVTAVVSPEKGQELSPLTIGRRVMALAEKNSPAFVKANANRAEKLKALDSLVSEVADLTTRKRQLEVELGTLDIELVDAVAQKQAAKRAARKQAAVVAPVPDLRAASSGNLGLHVTQYPSGRFGYAGTVPDEIAYEPGATQEQINNGKRFGGRFGPKKITFSSKEEATQYAKDRGFDVIVGGEQSATDELLNKLAAGYGYSAGVDAMPAGLMTTAKKLASAITSNDVKAAQDILHPSNKLSRKAFEFLFDGRVKLPNTVGGTDAVIKDFIDRVSDAAKAAAQTEPAPAAAPTSDQDPRAAADRALFQSIIDGTAPDLLSPELASEFEAAGERREKDPDMKSLFEQAVNVYQEAMLAATANLA